MAESSPAAKAGGKIDSLPKEELLKFIRKQANQMKELKRKFQECTTALESEKEEVHRLEREKKSWLTRGVSAEFEKKEKIAKKDDELKVAAQLGQQMLQEHDALKQQLVEQEEQHADIVEKLQNEIFELSAKSTELEEKVRTMQKGFDNANAEAKKCRDALEAVLSEQDVDQQKHVGVAKQATKKVQELKSKLKTIENEVNSKWQLQIDQLKEEKKIMSEGMLKAQADFQEQSAAASRSLKDKVIELQEENKKLQEKIYDIDLAYESVRAKNESLGVQLEENKNDNQNLENELQKLKIERDKFLKSYKIAKAKFEKSCILEEELKKQLSGISAERDEIQVSLRNVNKDRRNLLQSNKKMKMKLKAAVGEMEAEDEFKERGSPSPKLDEDLVLQLQSKNKELHEQLELVRGEKETSKVEKSELENALCLGDKERRNLVEETEGLKRQLENLKFELDEIQAGRHAIKEENKTLIEQLNELKTDKESLESDIDQLRVKFGSSEEHLTALQKELKEASENHSEAVNELRSQLDKASERESLLTVDVNEKDIKLTELEQNLTAVVNEKDQLGLRYHDLQRSLEEQQQVEGLNKEELESKMCQVMEDRKSIRCAYEELELKHEKLTEAFTMLEQVNKDLDAALKEIKDVTATLREEKTSLEGKLNKLQETLFQNEEQYKQQLEISTVKVDELERDLKSRSGDVSSISQGRDDALKTVDQLNEEMESLKHNISVSSTEIARLSDALRAAEETERSIAELNKEIECLKASNAELSESVNELTEHNEELTAKTQEDRTTICRLQARIEELLKALQALNEEKMHQECEIEDLFRAQDELHSQYDEQCRETKSFQEDVRALQEKYSVLEGQKSELESKLLLDSPKASELDHCSRQDSFSLREELTKLEEDLRLATLQLSEKDKLIERMELQLVEEQRQNFEKVKEVEMEAKSLQEDSSNACNQFESERQSLNEHVKEMELEKDTMTQRYEDEVSVCKETLQKHVNIEHGLKEELKTAVDRIRDVENRLTELTAINAGLKDAVKEFSDQNFELNGSNEEKQNDLVTLRLQHEDALKDLAVSKDDLQNAQEIVKELNRTTNELKSELASLSTVKEELEETLANLSREKSTNDEHVIELQRTLNSSEATMCETADMQQRQCDSLNETILELEKIRDELLNKVDLAEKELRTAVGRLGELEESCRLKDEKLSKFKSVALKAKKEYENVKAQMEESAKQFEEHHQNQHEASVHLTCELEELRLRCSQLENEKEVSSGDLNTAEQENRKAIEIIKELRSEVELLTSRLKDLESRLNAKENEFEIVSLQLKTSIEDVDQKQRQLQEAGSLKVELETTKESLTKASKEMESLNKDSHQLNVLQMELEDFQRTIANLQQKLEDKEGALTETTLKLQTTSDQLESQKAITDQEKQKFAQLEEKTGKFKGMIMKLKREMKDANVKEEELTRTASEQLKSIEAFKFELESHKLLLAKTAAENETLSLQMRSTSETHQVNYHAIERSLQQALADLASTQSELDECKADYEKYKIRAKNVLKQQKMKQQESANVTDDAEKNQLEEQLAEVKAQLDQSRLEFASMQTDQDVLETEHQRLQALHKRLETRFADATQEWQTRFANVEASADAAQSGFKERIRLLNEDRVKSRENHERELTELRLTLDKARASKAAPSSPPRHRRSREIDPDASSSDADTMDTLSQRRSSTPSKLSLPLLVEHSVSTERQQGEGMEQTQLEENRDLSTPVSPSLSTAGFLERILSPVASTPPAVWPNSPGESREEGLRLRSQLGTSEKKIDHLTEVLRDAEANSMRQNEQVKMLKDEIRRMERNQQREEALNNLEYLKNIIIKFMKCSPTEREYLVPVMCTMLKLDPDEKDFITEYAKGEPQSTNDPTDNSWSSYVYRWTAN